MGRVLKGGRKERWMDGWEQKPLSSAESGGINIPLSPRNGRFQILRACSIKWNRCRQRHIVSLAHKQKKITGQGHHSMGFKSSRRRYVQCGCPVPQCPSREYIDAIFRITVPAHEYNNYEPLVALPVEVSGHAGSTSPQTDPKPTPLPQ